MVDTPTAPSPARPAWRAGHWAGLLLGMLSGIALATQGRINGALGAATGDGLLTGLISFGGGWLLLLLGLAVVPNMRRGLVAVFRALRVGELRWWMCIGGLAGSILVVGQALTIDTLGVAMFTVAVVAAQSGSSLVVDRSRLGPSGPRPVTTPRVLGAVLTVVAVLIAVSDRLVLAGPGVLALLVLPLLAGTCAAAQQAVNGRVSQVAASPLTAALVNFTGGTAALALAWLSTLAVQGPVAALPANPVLYSGGALGVVFIGVAALVVRLVGVLLFGLANIAGQLAGAVLLDVLTPMHGGYPMTWTLVGVGLTLVAVLVATLPRQRRDTRAARAGTSRG